MTGLLCHQPPARSRPAKAAGPAGRLGHSGHERRVAKVALKLFDLLSNRHGLGADYRDLLEIAALVHDAAKPASPADHDVRGAEMVEADRSLPVTQRQRRAIAFLVRYHRDSTGAGVESSLIAGADSPALMTLLALLQAADGLDSRRVPLAAIIIRKVGRVLHITCLTAGKPSKARRRLARRQKFKLLRRTLGIDVRVRIERALDETIIAH